MEGINGNLIIYTALPKIIKRLLNFTHFNMQYRKISKPLQKSIKNMQSSYYTLAVSNIHTFLLESVLFFYHLHQQN